MQGAILVATCRPQNAEWVKAQYERQAMRLPLVVVLNGPAAEPRHRPDYSFAQLVLVAPKQKSEALHIGQQSIQSAGIDWILYWDDDDYYSPGYAARMAQAMGEARVAGQRCRYVKTQDNRLWRTLGPTSTIMGGCLAAHADVGNWSGMEPGIGPEQRWAKQLNEPILTLPPGLFAQCRWTQQTHVWPVGDRHVAYVSGGAVDVGPWNPEVVDGTAPEPEAVPIELTIRDLFDVHG